MADLVNTKPRKDEKLLEYINRWRNLSIKCERPITEGEAVEFIMRNIDNWMTPFLGVANIRTYHDLNQCIHRLETNPPPGWSGATFQRTQKNWKPEPKGIPNTKSFGARAEAQSIGTSKDENKGTFGDNNSSGKTLKELKSQPYSFRKDRVSKLFDDALRRGYLSLPESKRPADIEKSADPNYCKYHRIIGHPIEECFVFKNWLERKYKSGDIDISKKHLLDTPAPHEQVNQVSHIDRESHEDEGGLPWTVCISKRVRKMLRALQKEPGIWWKNGMTPIILDEPRGWEFRRRRPNKNGSLKRKSKKSAKPIPEKSELQKIIDALEEYKPGEPRPAQLKDFISEETWERILKETGELMETTNEENNEALEVESCCTIFHDECLIESCNMVRLGSDSEESEGEDGDPLSKLFEEEKDDEFDCCHTLRSGRIIPERQSPKEKGKGLHEGQEVEEQPSANNKPKFSVGEYNVLAHLRKIPALISVFDALMMSQDLRDALTYALQNPEQFQSYVVNITTEDAMHAHQGPDGIKFTKDDMLLGTADHNRPLYVTGECEGRHLNRILVDSGSSINIMPLRVLQSLTLNAKPLVKENVLIHGFNQSSQKALGSVVLNMKFGELVAPTKFFVIDAGTSYKALLGRP